MKAILALCNAGFGNRINILICLWVLMREYPSLTYYIYWNINNHCESDIEHILDIKHMFPDVIVIRDTETLGKIKYSENVRWCGTGSEKEDSPWDKITHWTSVPNVAVLTSHKFFKFCTQEDARYFLQNILRFTENINNLYMKTINQFNIEHDTVSVHIRTGDLLNILCSCNDMDSMTTHNKIIKDVSDQINKLKSNTRVLICTDDKKMYDTFQQKYSNVINRSVSDYALVVNSSQIVRNNESMIWSAVDFMLLLNTKIMVYCPYSTYSVLAALGNNTVKKDTIALNYYGIPKICVVTKE